MGLGALKKIGKGLKKAAEGIGSAVEEKAAEAKAHPGRTARNFQRTFLFDEQQLVQAWKHPSPRSIAEAAIEVGQGALTATMVGGGAFRLARGARLAEEGFKAGVAANKARRLAGLYPVTNLRHVPATRSRYLAATNPHSLEDLINAVKKAKPPKSGFRLK